jgi:uncharacterized LabA/DUF88 family protein
LSLIKFEIIYLAKDLASLEVVIVDYNYTIDGFTRIDMVDEVTLAQIDGDFTCNAKSNGAE